MPKEISAEDWLSKLTFVAKQTKEFMDKHRPFVRCGCLVKLAPHQAYKCLFCEEAFCKNCAEIHFGQTRAEYRAKHPIAQIHTQGVE